MTFNGNNHTTMSTTTLPTKTLKKAEVMTPDTALANYRHKLTSFEQHEIKKYAEIYFLGHKANKIHASTTSTANNNGYDDDHGSYKFTQHDHILYRYETLRILGRGTFGQVIKCYDHKLGSYCALKIVRNEHNFNRQAQEEIRILEHLKRYDADDKMNLIHIYDSFTFRNHVCITFELLSLYSFSSFFFVFACYASMKE
jgi:dual specificity tyrosine-phosphorylation-regulated kinase 2/3/4